MAKFEKQVTGDFCRVLAALEDAILSKGVSMQLVDKSDYSAGGTIIAVRVFDKYYMRNGNRASLTVTLVGHGTDIFVSAIGAGGGQGVFINFSWGAESDLVTIVEESLESIT